MTTHPPASQPRRRDGNRGNSLIEFTLVGIPLIFVLLSIFEISRGMFLYVSVSHGVRDAARFASVHGANCYVSGNSCGITVGDVALRFANQTGGFDADAVTLRISAGCPIEQEASVAPCLSTQTGSLASLLASTAPWPDIAEPTIDSIEIHATVPFRTMLAMLWPGAGVVQMMGTYDLRAVSREAVHF